MRKLGKLSKDLWDSPTERNFQQEFAELHDRTENRWLLGRDDVNTIATACGQRSVALGNSTSTIKASAQSTRDHLTCAATVNELLPPEGNVRMPVSASVVSHS